MSFSKEELTKYRIERCKEALEDAKILMEKERWNAATNRLYYACFYIVSAYLAFYSLKATTHAGIKTIFNRELVNTGKISREDGVLFNKLFGARQDADYEDFVEMGRKDLEPLLPKVANLILEIEKLMI